MITNGLRHKKGAKGKLISNSYVPVAGNIGVCTKCGFHDADSLTPATVARVMEYEFMTVNVPFCALHAAECETLHPAQS